VRSGADSGAPLRRDLADAVRLLADGGLVAFPTETVWGLAARSDCDGALQALRRWKGRAADRPVALLVTDLDAAREAGAEPGEAAAALAAAFWPGPLTLVVPARSASGAQRHSGRAGVGLRCSPHPVARGLAEAARAAGLAPLTATSLNRSGEAPAASRAAARALCDSGAAQAGPRLLASGCDAGGAPPSTVVEAGAGLRILREGAIAVEAIERVWRAVRGARAATQRPQRG